MRTRIAALLPLAVALTLAVAACSKSDSEGTGDGGGGASGTSITIRGLAFNPNALSGGAGETLQITVTNEDAVEHSFTLDDDSVSQDIEGGDTQTVEVTLPDSGSIGWHCKYHPQMTGTITVA
jgi:plastocyanin